MREIEVRFRITMEDLITYNKSMMKSRNRISNIFFFAIAAYFIFSSFMNNEISYTLIAALVFIALIFAIRIIFRNKGVEKAYKKYYGLKTDLIVEFYNDHLVEKNEGGETGISFETHFPLEAIQRIIETEEQYLLMTSPAEMIMIPKRTVSAEDKEKLGNLIANVFQNRYEKRF